MKTIATVCARGGSRGLPRKNVRDLDGKPLIVHTIRHAQACARIDDVYVSTDDEEIAQIAREAGAAVPFIRPAELASDTATKLAVIQHLVDWLERQGVELQRIVELQPTSPLRLVEDIDSCLNLLDPETDVVITGYLADKNPYFDMVEMEEAGTVRLVKSPVSDVLRRQDAPAVYAMNGAVYVWHRQTLSRGLWGGRAKLHVMPRDRSVDIDDEFDWMMAEVLMRERQRLGDPDWKSAR